MPLLEMYAGGGGTALVGTLDYTEEEMISKARIILVLCPSWGIETPHLGIALLAANLRKHSFQVKVRDFNIRIHNKNRAQGLWKSEEDVHWEDEGFLRRFIQNNNELLDSFVEEILATGYEVIGFSVYNTTKRLSLELARRIKQRDKSKIIICGGQMCFPKAAAEYLIRESAIDAVVMGEGDEVIVNLMRKIIELGKVGSCPGVFYKDNGKIIDCGIAPPIMNLDNLPYPDFSDFNLKLYGNPTQLPILSGRGCPYQCAFCNTKLFWVKYRSMSGERIFQEVLYQLNNYKDVHFFTFNDHTANANMEALSRFVDLAIELKRKPDCQIRDYVNFSWRGAVVIRKEMDRDFVNKLRRSGCIELEFGIESASNKVRKLMRKPPDDVKIVERVIKDVTEAGIGVRANFMFGFPQETEEDFRETLEFLKRNKDYFVQVHPSETFCHIDPDTYMYNHLEEFAVIRHQDNSVYWESTDGKNIYPERLRRHQQFCQLAVSLGIPLSPGGHKVILYKDKLLKEYADYMYAHQKDQGQLSMGDNINITQEREKPLEVKAPKVRFNWHLLYKCNYRCPYCFYFGNWQELPKVDGADSLKKWLEAWHRIYERFGSVFIEITGGEPFIYPSFAELIKGLTSEHAVSVVTNLSWSIEKLTKLINQIDSSQLKMCLSFHPLFAKFDVFLEKVLFLKSKGISDRVLYVTYPPQLKQMGYFKDKFQQKGIELVPVPFRGEYKGTAYPQGYSTEEKNIIHGHLKNLDETQKRWVQDQVARESTRGKLCRAGMEYVHIDVNGTAYRCSWAKADSKPIGSFFDKDFRPLNKPLPCMSANGCPCEAKWLVEEPSSIQHLNKEKRTTLPEKVKQRMFGKTGLMIAEVGIGGHEYSLEGGERYQPFEERTKTIGKALDLGINFFDICSDNEGISLGRVLKALKARDKCCIAYGENVEGYRVYNADEKFIRKCVERQLQFLQTDRIDVFRVLDWSISDYIRKMKVPVEEEIGNISLILNKLKKEGKIRFSSFGTHLQDTLEHLAGKTKIGELFDVLQVRFNFLECGPAKEIIPYAKAQNMGIVVIKPFRKGTLLNKSFSGSTDPTYTDARPPTDRIFANLKYKEKGLAYALLKFILSNPDISTVIPGVASIEQLIENANVSIFG